MECTSIFRKCLALLMCFWALSLHSQTRKPLPRLVSVETELFRLLDIGQLPLYMNGTKVKQVSSYDRTGGNDDGFSGKYSYLYNEKNGGLVIFDAKGRGVIERIWTPTPTDDTLDFYFDGHTAPDFSIRFRDLFSGKVAPFLKPLVDAHKVGGYYSYIPIPYEKGCKIVFRGGRIMFHQIQYREYDGSFRVQTFNPNFSVAANGLLKKIIALWDDPDHRVENFSHKGVIAASKNIEMKPGETRLLAGIRGGGRILGIELKPSSSLSGLLRQLDLKITWDDEAAPALYVPAADFFGYAFGEKSMRALLAGATNSKAYCYIPMPFDKSARVELVYRPVPGSGDAAPLTLSTNVYYNLTRRNAASEGKFYAWWNNDHPPLGQPHIFLQGKGKGHYIGTLLQSQATEFTHFTEFFEGDDVTLIDDSLVMHGTGSEDYFNGGWYAQPGGWVERLGAPLSGCLDYSLPLSRTGGYRFFVNDKMNFNKSFHHSMEHGPENNNREVHYISLAMYYAPQPLALNKAPDHFVTKVFIPDTVTFYTRLMRHLTYNGGFEFKDGSAVMNAADNTVMNINVAEVPKGRYKIYLHKQSSRVNNLKVRLADASAIQPWATVTMSEGNKEENVWIGDTEVSDGSIPTTVLFASDQKNPGVKFDRVLFIKQ